MNCQQCREALSAGLDGEATAEEAAAAERHVARCAACRAAGERAARMTRTVRDAAVEPAPDPAAVIGAALAAARHPAGPPRPQWVATVQEMIATAARVFGSPRGAGPAAADGTCTAPLHLHVVGSAACGCAVSCRCGCQDGRPCRCATRAA